MNVLRFHHISVKGMSRNCASNLPHLRDNFLVRKFVFGGRLHVLPHFVKNRQYDLTREKLLTAYTEHS